MALALILTVVVVEVDPLAQAFGFMVGDHQVLKIEALGVALLLAFLIIPIMEVYKAIMRAVEKNKA